MEQFEEECAQLRQKVGDLEQTSSDMNIKSGVAQRDKDDMRKKLS